MERLIDGINLDNFKDKHAKLWKDENPEEIRDWIKKSIDSTSGTHQLYRILLIDLDADVANAAPYIAGLKNSGESLFGLTRMWQFLLRHHAFGAALVVSSSLKKAGEPLPWRLWRLKDLLHWRLAIGILAGFLLLSSSSLLQDILKSAQAKRGWLACLPAVSLAAIFLHTLANVLNRTAGLPRLTALARAAVVTFIGAAYAAVGGFAIYMGARNLQMTPPLGLVLLSSATALLLGFVFHLFWQDRSIGDPL
ncbi:MAG: hypothetical protein LAO78_11215 [Acidobacteriia bacterium]|nr:hypothetical protein [Terriglobia bacterium]